eukprot:scpid78620/ scgid5557/ Phosphatidylinositol-glycan biosynthesis class W protein
MTYKEEHEAFVSNHHGTSLWEIFLLTALLPPLCNYTYFAIRPRLVFEWPKWSDHVVQFLSLALPILLLFTYFADVSWLVGVPFLVLPVLHITNVFTSTGLSSAHSATSGPLASAVTALRAFINIATAVAILGVDFAVWPRRLAKVETFGTGLMDVGVGQYVFSMALVSREARQKPRESLLHGWKTFLALVVLGSGRLLTTKAAAYQEHTSEYGVHWNFFFTLAALKIFTLLISAVWQNKAPSLPTASSTSFWSPLITGGLLGITYQVLLENAGWSEFIQHSWAGDGARGDWISANREGLLSSLGYFSLYSLSVQLGRCLWSGQRRMRCSLLFSLVPLVLLETLSLAGIVQPISRRMANLPFILWQVHLGTSVLLAFYVLYGYMLPTQIVKQAAVTNTAAGQLVNVESPSPPVLLSAISHNQLLFFLAANLGTGIVNMSMKTIYVSNLTAMCILSIYLAVLCILAIALYGKPPERKSQ